MGLKYNPKDHGKEYKIILHFLSRSIKYQINTEYFSYYQQCETQNSLHMAKTKLFLRGRKIFAYTKPHK